MNYFTTKRAFFLVPSNRCIEEFDKIDNFLSILEKSNVGELISYIYKKNKTTDVGRKGYNPFKLFATIIYCFSNFKSSLREIEKLCIYDVRIMYIMEQQMPDHSIIGKFINKYIVPYQYEIFTMIMKTIIDEYKIDISVQYLDGTKIEANANKYKFVWKPTKFHNKLDAKIKELIKSMGYQLNDEKKLIKSATFNEILKSYVLQEKIDINNIPNGRGVRYTNAQKNYKLGHKYLLKLLEYEEKEEICGENRNSYFKTDHDATAMVLKEDYYSKLSHDFHAAYNFQSLISAGFIIMYGLFQDRSDYYTFTPMLDLYYEYYKKYPKNICADSGYGIYVNYKYIRKHGIGNYIKFLSWKGESSGKNPQLFYAFEDGVLCLNANIGEEIPFKNTHQRNKDGRLYKFNGCNSCNYAYKCKSKMKPQNRDKDYRTIELVTDYELLKEEARNNLLSPRGIEIRINRSIQVEGGFGHIKEDMGYDRIRRRGLEKASAEIMLMSLGKNIKRLFSIMYEDEIDSLFWKASSELKKETFPFPKQKKKKS